jgi:signal transduction histidine kinase
MSQIQDITDLRTAERGLREYQRQLRSLASELSLVEKQERRRLAAGLHDGVGQTMALIKFRLGAAKDLVREPDVRKLLHDIGELLDDAIQQTRSLTFELSPPILYELGLEPALEWLLEQFGKEYGLSCRFEHDGQQKSSADDIRGLLFSAVRELLVNVVKHAQASAVHVFVGGEGKNILVRVEDDGVGFNVHDKRWKRRGFGLFSMRERLKALGGHIEVRSDPGRGTAITLLAPMDIDDRKAEEKQGEPI